MCRDEQKMPSKSQIALALSCIIRFSVRPSGGGGRERETETNPCQVTDREEESRVLRFWIELVQEPAAVVLVEDPREAPRVVLEWLHVLDLNQEHVTRFSGLNLKGPRQVVDLGQVDIFHIVGTIVILDLATSPIEAFDFDRLAVFDGPSRGH